MVSARSSVPMRFDPPPDEVTALGVANAAQGTHKVVKIGVGWDPGVLRFHAPVLLRGLPPARELLDRCVVLLRHTAGEFRELLWGAASSAGVSDGLLIPGPGDHVTPDVLENRLHDSLA